MRTSLAIAAQSGLKAALATTLALLGSTNLAPSPLSFKQLLGAAILAFLTKAVWKLLELPAPASPNDTPE